MDELDHEHEADAVVADTGGETHNHFRPTKYKARRPVLVNQQSKVYSVT